MTVTFISFVRQIEVYRSRWPDESSACDRFISLLSHQAAFERTHFPGHITGSAFIVSPDYTQTLLVHHAKLNKWLQPGGHADGDTDVPGVAMREATEETGVTRLSFGQPSIFDLDIHTIPARSDFPQHDHYDVRYLVVASPEEQTAVSEESHDVRWVSLSDLHTYNKEESILRMRAKILLLSPGH